MRRAALACLALLSLQAAAEAKRNDVFCDALGSGNYERVEKLIAAGADVNATAGTGEAPLHCAMYPIVTAKDTRFVRLLLEHGAKPDPRNDKGETPLLDALNVADPMGQEASREVVDLLLAAGADVNARADDGTTILWKAVEAGDPEIVRKLVEKKVDVRAAGPKGKTPLVHAFTCAQANKEIVLALLKHDNVEEHDEKGETVLMWAANNGYSDIVQQALTYSKKSINAQEQRHGFTALMEGAVLGQSEAVRLLLLYGADPKIKNPAGQTARLLATINNHPETAKLIADYEAALAGGPAESAVAPAKVLNSDIDAAKHHLAERPDDYALIIGVEKYANELPDAQFAQRDAQAVRAHLAALGVPERNIKVLDGSRATLSAMSAYLEDWLPKNAKATGRVYFYFSGHGAPDPKTSQAFLVPFDGSPAFLDKTAFPVRRLYEDLGKLKARSVVAVLDSCFSGAGGRSVLAEGTRPLVNQVDTSVTPGSKILLFAAAAPAEVTSTLKEQGHGLFTYYFLKGLDGAAADKSGAVTPLGLYEYLKPKVQDEASRQNREQTPVLEGAVGGELARFPKE